MKHFTEAFAQKRPTKKARTCSKCIQKGKGHYHSERMRCRLRFERARAPSTGYQEPTFASFPPETRAELFITTKSHWMLSVYLFVYTKRARLHPSARSAGHRFEVVLVVLEAYFLH